jgi:preprotein translocase subunit SecG
MLQEGDEDDEGPSFHGGTKHPDKHDEKLEDTSSSKTVILTVLLIIIVIVAVLLGAYYYRHLWYKGERLDFR